MSITKTMTFHTDKEKPLGLPAALCASVCVYTHNKATVSGCEAYSSLWSYLSGPALTVSGKHVCNMKQNKTWLLAVTHTGWPSLCLDTNTHTHMHSVYTYTHSVWSFLWHSPLVHIIYALHHRNVLASGCWWVSESQKSHCSKPSTPHLCVPWSSLFCHIWQVQLIQYKPQSPCINVMLPQKRQSYTCSIAIPHFHQLSFIQDLFGWNLTTLHLHLTLICIFMH